MLCAIRWLFSGDCGPTGAFGVDIYQLYPHQLLNKRRSDTSLTSIAQSGECSLRVTLQNYQSNSTTTFVKNRLPFSGMAHSSI